MGILKLLGDTSMAQLNDLHDRQKAAGLAYLQGPGNRRRGVRTDSGSDGRRSTDHAGRPADMGNHNRRLTYINETL